jgi:hypothetical protein
VSAGAAWHDIGKCRMAVNGFYEPIVPDDARRMHDRKQCKSAAQEVWERVVIAGNNITQISKDL